MLDDAAARHFLEDLAICNKASTSEIIDVSTLGEAVVVWQAAGRPWLAPPRMWLATDCMGICGKGKAHMHICSTRQFSIATHARTHAHARAQDIHASAHTHTHVRMHNTQANMHARARTTRAGPTDVPGVPGTSFCCCVHGRQRIGKGRQDAASCGNTVDLLLAVVRLPHVASDLLVTLNTPVHIDPASASAADAGAGHKDAAHSGQLLRRVLHSFRIDDWGLFGEGDGHQ